MTILTQKFIPTSYKNDILIYIITKRQLKLTRLMENTN